MTFKGGIHPEYDKELTRFFATKEFEAPNELILPLSQHIGARSKAIVNVGDSVAKYDLIAEADGMVSSNLHSPISGTVKAIEERPSAYGTNVECIIIEKSEELAPELPLKNADLDNISAGEILDVVKNAGICGLGGATFPTHVKLAPPADKKIEKIIINGAECEPYLTCDHRAMLEDTEELIFGVQAILRATGATEAYIAIERNKMDAILNVLAHIRTEENIHISPLETKYPQGAEKNLIQAIFNKKIPPKTLPLDNGFAVFNVGTTIAIARAIKYNEPLVSRRVTVYDKASQKSATYNIPIGTLVSEVLERLDLKVAENGKVILGGPMMGTAIYRTDIPVTKGTSGIVIIPEEESEEPTSCIRCGQCVANCPMNLMPVNLAKYAIKHDGEELDRHNVMDCVECGICSYTCPAKIHLTQEIKAGKQIKSGVAKI